MPTRTACCSVAGCPRLVRNGGRCGYDCCGGRCRGPRDERPNSAARGYGSAWRHIRAAFLAANPICVGVDGEHHPNCNRQATVPDHSPITRRQLVERGDPNPDAWHHLVPLSASCHGLKSVRYDGAWGRGGRNP